MHLARIPAAAADTTPTPATPTVPPVAATTVATRATLLEAVTMEAAAAVVATVAVPWSNVVAPVLPAVSTCASTATRRVIGPPHAPSRRIKGSATRAANEVMRNETAPREDRSTMETPARQEDSNNSRRRNSSRCPPRRAVASPVEQEDADAAARALPSRSSNAVEEAAAALDPARARAAGDDRLRRVSKCQVSS
jgi:hypothetical protein